MTEELHKGDKVQWETSQGTTEGTVLKKLTEPIQIKSHTVKASEENPEFLVKSDKTGAKAAHKPESLTKVDEAESGSSGHNKKKKDDEEEEEETKDNKKRAKEDDEEEKTEEPEKKHSKKNEKDDADEELIDDPKNEEIYEDFKKLVNMKPKEIEEWLDTEESKSVGFKNEGSDESVGHQSGKKIIKILEKDEKDLDEEDFQHMRKVRSCKNFRKPNPSNLTDIKRHSAQRPNKDDDALEHSRWCYSLKNWGHDPLQE